jgi:AcrR family transcriptional regulator
MPARPSRTVHGGGRPRSERARRAVLDAARNLFQEGGYSAATVEGIAAQAGVAKTTIYRSWPNRSALLVELMLELAAEAAPPPTGTDPLHAIRTEVRMVAEAAGELSGRLFLSLMGEAQQDPEVRDALLRGLYNPRRQATAEVVRRAQEAGLIRREVPPLLAVDLFFGAMFYRRFVRGEPATSEFLKQAFDLTLSGLAPAATKTSRSPRKGKTRS